MAENILTTDDVLKRLQISRATLYRLINKGQFPPAMKVAGCSRWRASDVRKAIQDFPRIARKARRGRDEES